MKYTIDAIPTTYKGIEFRSKLEARWACFLDRFNFSWDYEPINLNGWFPDFAIYGSDVTAFVEVKPIIDRPDEVMRKMELATLPEQELLILGAHPFTIYGHLLLGWGRRPNDPGWFGAGMGKVGSNGLQIGPFPECGTQLNTEIETTWANAVNKTKWKR